MKPPWLLSLRGWKIPWEASQALLGPHCPSPACPGGTCRSWWLFGSWEGWPPPVSQDLQLLHCSLAKGTVPPGTKWSLGTAARFQHICSVSSSLAEHVFSWVRSKCIKRRKKKSKSTKSRDEAWFAPKQQISSSFLDLNVVRKRNVFQKKSNCCGTKYKFIYINIYVLCEWQGCEGLADKGNMKKHFLSVIPSLPCAQRMWRSISRAGFPAQGLIWAGALSPPAHYRAH